VEQRSQDIRTNILTVSEQALVDDLNTPQGQALTWLIEDDDRLLCPLDDLIQRWVLAVIYFSTGGDNWDQCSDAGIDLCGSQDPFLTKRRFLSSFNECQWAGISCNINSKVTEIEFEENNLIGTIPTEIGLLTDLAIWGMERGGLTGSIPTQIGVCTLAFSQATFFSIISYFAVNVYFRICAISSFLISILMICLEPFLRNSICSLASLSLTSTITALLETLIKLVYLNSLNSFRFMPTCLQDRFLHP